MHPYEFPSTSYNVNDVTRIYNVDMHAKKETCVMDLCHKQVDRVCQPLDEAYLVEDLPCEPHQLSVSPRVNQENLMAAINNFVDTNALVTRCCWRDSSEELEG